MSSVICYGQFLGGEIEPGTFHGGEIEPGTFHHFNPNLEDLDGQKKNMNDSEKKKIRDGSKPEDRPESDRPQKD